MAKEHSHSPEIDLDKTDRLPILDSALFDHDVEDDAVPMDRTAILTGPAPAPAGSASDFVRPSGIDLPSLAESVRSGPARWRPTWRRPGPRSTPNMAGCVIWSGPWPREAAPARPPARGPRKRCANRSATKANRGRSEMPWRRAIRP